MLCSKLLADGQELCDKNDAMRNESAKSATTYKPALLVSVDAVRAAWHVMTVNLCTMWVEAGQCARRVRGVFQNIATTIRIVLPCST